MLDTIKKGPATQAHPAGLIDGWERCNRALGRGQLIVFEDFAQFQLVDLAGRAERDFLDEGDIVGRPPFGDLAFQLGQALPLWLALRQGQAD